MIISTLAKYINKELHYTDRLTDFGQQFIYIRSLWFPKSVAIFLPQLFADLSREEAAAVVQFAQFLLIIYLLIASKRWHFTSFKSQNIMSLNFL